MCLPFLLQARPRGHLISHLEAKVWYPVASGQQVGPKGTWEAWRMDKGSRRGRGLGRFNAGEMIPVQAGKGVVWAWGQTASASVSALALFWTPG